MEKPTAGTPFVASAQVKPRSFLARLAGRGRPDLAGLRPWKLSSRPSTRVRFHDVRLTACSRHMGSTLRTRASCASECGAGRWKHLSRMTFLTPEERDFLSALRRLLDIGETDVIALEKELVYPRYQRILADVLSDDEISQTERVRFRTLARGSLSHRPSSNTCLKMLGARSLTASSGR